MNSFPFSVDNRTEKPSFSDATWLFVVVLADGKQITVRADRYLIEDGVLIFRTKGFGKTLSIAPGVWTMIDHDGSSGEGTWPSSVDEVFRRNHTPLVAE